MWAQLGWVLHWVSHRLRSRGPLGLGPHLRPQSGQDPVQTQWSWVGVSFLVAVGWRLPCSLPHGPFHRTAPNVAAGSVRGASEGAGQVERGMSSTLTSPHSLLGIGHWVQHILTNADRARQATQKELAGTCVADRVMFCMLKARACCQPANRQPVEVAVYHHQLLQLFGNTCSLFPRSRKSGFSYAVLYS